MTTMTGNNVRLLILSLNIILISGFIACNTDQAARKKVVGSSAEQISARFYAKLQRNTLRSVLSLYHQKFRHLERHSALLPSAEKIF